jgi:hypothetical protein
MKCSSDTLEGENSLKSEKTTQRVKAIIEHYLPLEKSRNRACKRAVEEMGKPCNYKTLYHISRGQSAGADLTQAINRFYNQLQDPPTPKGRSVYLAGDPEEIDLILSELTPRERTCALLHAIGDLGPFTQEELVVAVNTETNNFTRSES